MRRTPAAAALILAFLLLPALSACTGAGASSEDSLVPGIAEPGAMDPGGNGTDTNGTGGTVGDESGGGAPSSGADVPGEDVDDGRAVITTGSVTLTVTDPIDAADEATRIVETAGGRVDERVEYAPGEDDGGRAILTVRIPSALFSATLDDLQRMGEVESVQLTATDVTARTEDLDARIDALRASTGRLLALLETAETTEDLLKVESALATRQAELESLEAQRASLADSVALTTVTLNLLSEGIAPPAAPGNFWAGIVAGFTGLLAALGAFAVGLGVLLPWLVFAAILALMVLLTVRASARRRRRPSAPEDETVDPRMARGGDGNDAL
ncbi:DUF4349 domain-containing protein [Planctomonas psychrotolerans]|uniref:DUF4349 domain-containing protein n=1 Tax=Planctomonas psychrotolerans TaxID=2528712 RepID=UPI001D0D73F2|nr:DUF4349 domain-containing protein [Planctomonas psychrotolerans]